MIVFVPVYGLTKSELFIFFSKSVLDIDGVPSDHSVSCFYHLLLDTSVCGKMIKRMECLDLVFGFLHFQIVDISQRSVF